MSNAKHVVENLSAYLDDELSDAERARVEAHLRTCAQCQRELESLRYTMRMVQELPTVRAPRAFTLSDEQAGRVRPAGWFMLALRAMTALSALLLIVVVSADLFWLNAGGAVSQPAQAPGAAIAAPTQARAAEAANPDTVQSKAAPTAAPAAPGAFELRLTPTTLPPLAQPATQAAVPAVPATPTTTSRSPVPAGASTLPSPSATATLSPTATATNTPLPPATATATATATRTLTPLPPRLSLDRLLPLRLIEIGLFGLLALGVRTLIVLRVMSR